MGAVIGGLVFGLIFVPIGGFMIWFSRKQADKAALIERTPTTQVQNLTPGLRESKGKCVSAGELLTSPMKQRKCVYYRFQVKEKRHKAGRKGGSHYVTVVDDVQSVPFMLDDGSGQVRINAQGAEMYLGRDSYTRSGTLNDAPPEIENLLQQRYGKSSQGMIFNKAMTYEETVLEVGDDVYVLGLVADRGGSLAFSAGGEVFLLSDGSEESLKGAMKAGGTVMIVIGLMFVALGLAVPALLLMAKR